MGRICSRIIVPSERTRKALAWKLRSADHSKIEVIPSPIDPTRFHLPDGSPSAEELRAAAGVPKEALVILMIAQHVPWKGHMDLAQAFPMILKECPDAILVILGGPWNKSDRRYSRQIHERFNELVIRGKAFLQPPSPAVEHYYWMSDVLVLPSKREPFGRVVFEAIAADLSVTVAGDAGVASYVADIAPELVFEPGDPTEMARCVVRVLKAPPETKGRWVSKGRSILKEVFAPGVVVPEIEMAYLRAMGRVQSRDARQ
jgi:glycosyltransferase involved in cell wall biosynthesis